MNVLIVLVLIDKNRRRTQMSINRLIDKEWNVYK